MIQCMAPDPHLGVALRVASYLDCQSRALGENGFQALTGGPAMTAVLSGLVTIFVALIGYRMIMGSVPGVRDGIGWSMRLGIVLALVTSWPAFQTLVYRVMVDGPQELASVILPAAGLTSDSIDGRIQLSYDRIRLGSSDLLAAEAAQPAQPPGPAGTVAPPAPTATGSVPGLTPLPLTASLFVASTSGVVGALRLVTGFLIAIAPIAILCLLFQGTVAIFDGWVRAVIGAAFGVLAASITTAIEVVLVESEIAHADAVQLGADAAGSYDPQALITIILLSVVVALAAIFAAARVASAFRLPVLGDAFRQARGDVAVSLGSQASASATNARATEKAGLAGQRPRTAAVADALAAAAYRDQAQLAGHNAAEGSSRHMTIRQDSSGSPAIPVMPLGVAGRRSTGKRTQSARRRDMPA